jgi:phosphoribosylanthranilate isomerase
LIDMLGSHIKPIGVFVDHSFDEMVEIINYCNLYGVQLHGDYKQDFEYAKKLKRLIISKGIQLKVIWKSISIGKGSGEKGSGDYTKNLDRDETDHIKKIKIDIENMEPYVDAILFDTYKKGEKGGTGEVFNWELLDAFEVKVERILAGGLSPDNIVDAIHTVRPDTVDVNSSLEVELIKTKEKVDRLFNRLKEV